MLKVPPPLSHAKKNGVCLTLKNYGLPNTKYVSNVPIDETNGNASWKPEIVINCINWKKILNDL